MRFSVFLALCVLDGTKGFFAKANAEPAGIVQQRDSAAGHPEFPSGPIHRHTRHLEQRLATEYPSTVDILRYRYHHGTNLGSIYVAERWMQSSRFTDATTGTSELAAVKGWVNKIGLAATKKQFEADWANAVTDADIQWLKNTAKATTIRLPIGYWDLTGSEFTTGTPFAPYASVYSGAWASIRSLITRLRAESIGVLIDMHALPGGANKGEHSGTNSGVAAFWTSASNRALGVKACKFLAREVAGGLPVAGIQIVNEADYASPNMYAWYDQCVSAISAIDTTVPIIISDGWNLAEAADYALSKNAPFVKRAPVVIDTHFYWLFTDEDKQKSPSTINKEAAVALEQLDGREGSIIGRGAVQVLVGEYACVLADSSWDLGGSTPKETLVRNFGLAQTKRWQARAGGSFFWSWKLDFMPGGGWGFKAQSELKNIPPPKHASLTQSARSSLLAKAKSVKATRGSAALKAHIAYWAEKNPSGTYDNAKFEAGWNLGWQDAYIFLEGRSSQGDIIGLVEMWVLKRIRDSGYTTSTTWQFEQGLRKGIADFYTEVGL